MELVAIAYSLAFNLTGCIIILFFFSLSIRLGSPLTSPRCANRPEEVRFLGGRGGWWKNTFGWIPYVMSLSYRQMLTGIPSTGTRSLGNYGPLLKMNLDGIVFLRFHEMSLKFCSIVTLIALGISLPLNYTARCYDLGNENNGNDDNEACLNLSNFDRTTTANIASRDLDSANGFIDIAGMQVRSFAIAALVWIVSFVLCWFLWQEYEFLLGLRRKYYLEADHYRDRVDGEAQVEALGDDEESEKRRLLTKTEPWRVNPERFETAPSIELYSVLVGNLPSKPSEILSHKNSNMPTESSGDDNYDSDDTPRDGNSEDEKSRNVLKIINSIPTTEWQLAVTSAMFDRAITGEDCYTSSVAAVTVLPDPECLATSWRNWYKSIAVQRRLNYVRHLLNKQGYTTSSTEFEFIHQSNTKNLIDPFSNVPHHGSAQSAMYSRELAQSSAMCCPLGCQQEKLDNMCIDGLLDEEAALLERVLMTSHNLKDAQIAAIMKANKERPSEVSHSSKKKKNGKKEYKRPSRKLTDEIQLTEVFDRIKHDKHNTPPPLTQRRGHAHHASMSMLGSTQKPPQGSVLTARRHRPTQTMVPGTGRMDGVTSSKNFSFGDIFNPGDIFGSAEKEKTTTPTERGEDESNIAARKKNNIIYHKDVKEPIKINLPPFSPRNPRNPEAPFIPHTDSYSSAIHNKSPRRSSIFILPSPRNLSKVASLRKLKSPPVILKASASENTAVEVQVRSRAKTEDHVSVHATRDRDGLKVNGRGRGRGRLSSADDVLADLMRDIREEDEGDGKAVFSLTTDGILLTARQDTLQKAKSNIAEGGDECKHTSDTDGRWTALTFKRVCKFFTRICKGAFRWCCRCSCLRDLLSSSTRVAKKKLVNGGSYAVVTFTSRQAAATARGCSIDGRGSARWCVVQDLPVSPLSDAAPLDIMTCRNCCRPVTLSLNPGQKKIRKYIGYFCLFIVYTSYMIPIAWISELTSRNISTVFPDWNSLPPRYQNMISGFVSSLALTIFLSIAPYLFKMISNFSSGAESLNAAERSTLKYYWFFQLLTCCTGSFFANIILNLINFGNTGDLFFGTTAKAAFQKIAVDLPTVSSALWLNWTLTRTFIILPLQYLLQFNAHLFLFFRLHCCSRIQQGGGMGGPLPFRVYVDSAVVLLIAVTFATMSPLVLPFTLLYFMVCIPLWRRNLLVTYRPMFDAGGLRWPFLFTTAMSSLYFSIVMVALVLLLKNMFTPALITFIAIIPAADFHITCNKRFKRAYADVGLMQAGLINESDKKRGVLDSRSFTFENFQEKEQFREWIVDAHLAAFIPVCMSDNQTLVDTLTAAPAATFCQQDLEDFQATCDGVNLSDPPPPSFSDNNHAGIDDILSVTSSSDSSLSPAKLDEDRAILQERRKRLRERALIQAEMKLEEEREGKNRRRIKKGKVKRERKEKVKEEKKRGIF